MTVLALFFTSFLSISLFITAKPALKVHYNWFANTKLVMACSGSSSSYCGTGCDPNFGTCTPVSGGISDTTNGLCGTKFMATCSNYGAKTCCSQYGFW